MRKVMLCVSLLVAGCEKPMSPAEEKAADDRAVAQVEATERALPPLRPVSPQPLRRTFVARHAVGGPGVAPNGCAFVRPDETVIALTLGARALMLIDGQPAEFSADKGSKRQSGGAWSHYDGKALALALTETGNAARLVVLDPYNRAVFQTDGTLRCPAI